MHVPARLVAPAAALLVVLGCADKAEPPYAKCVQLKVQDDIEGAWSACNDAVGADPTSKAGQAAVKVLAEIKPAYDKRKAEREAREVKEAEERKRVEGEQRAARMKELRTRVTQEWYDRDPSAACTGKGLPPYKWKYSGGSYAEDAEVATADGCVAPYNFNGQNTDFCCPEKP